MPQAQTEQVEFVLRLSPSLHKKIKRRARTNNTSMNKEITNVLSDAMSGAGVEKALEDLIYRLEKKKVI